MIRSAAKNFVEALAAIATLPAVLIYRLQSALFGKDRAFPGWSQAFALLPGLTGIYLRRAFYRRVLRRCGDGACIEFGVLFSHPTASVGRNVFIGPYSMIGGVTIEDDCLLGSHVSILNGLRQHGIERLDVPVREQAGVFEDVTIGRDSWIGERAVVAASVGPQCIIGAGSLVTRPIPERAIAIGSPAKVHRFRE